MEIQNRNKPMKVRMKDGSVNRDQQMKRLKTKRVKCRLGDRFLKKTRDKTKRMSKK